MLKAKAAQKMGNKFLSGIAKAKTFDKTRTKVLTHNPANPGNWYSVVVNINGQLLLKKGYLRIL